MTFKEINNIKKLLFGLFVFFAGIGVGVFTSEVIVEKFSSRVLADDLFMNSLPYIEVLEYYTDITVFILTILFSLYIVNKRFHILPMVLTAIGSGYFFRGIFNMLTPLGRPTGMPYNHGILGYFYRYYDIQIWPVNEGMFPSGHILLAVLYLFFIDRKKEPELFVLMVLLNIIGAVLMVWSRGHYSIDIVGGIMLAIIIGQNIWRYKDRLTMK